MDEVHHLLDYWAIVIKELLKRIGGVILIGLTATPPLSAGEDELENYISIMGEIDFEIPTPAVVKEGNLSPYQDLVYFCTPSPKEKEFIDSLEERFKALISNIGERESFKKWVQQRVLERKLSDGTKQDWTQFFNSHPFLAVAGVKWIVEHLTVDLPEDIVGIEEMDQKMSLDDWVYLLTDYSLNYLKLSGEKKQHDELREIQAVIKSFGYALTEEGLRQIRSPSDMVLAFSESKNKATVSILQTEMASMKDMLRAVVITDFEKQSATATKVLEGILDKESGSAFRAYRYIVQDPVTTELESILVTGSTLLVDSDKLEDILKCMKDWKEACGLRFEFSAKKTGYGKIAEISGSGPDWGSNTYVLMVTSLFEKGTTRCIIGTRGLLGEGWDSLKLNTLIDLTSATTSTTVNQVRGRSIRLDPEWKTKVANNWDIVCVDASFEKGNQDFERFQIKHERFYGLGSKRKIVKGILHVDDQLLMEYSTIGFKQILYHMVNERMLARSKDRSSVYERWEVGKEYSNFEYWATTLDAKDLKFQTVYTLKDSLKPYSTTSSLPSVHSLCGTSICSTGSLLKDRLN